MKKFIALLLITLTITVAHAQNYQWAHGFGGPSFDSQGNSIATDAQGNVYVTGTFGDSIDFDPGISNDTLPADGETMFVGKYDSSGIYQWAFATEGFGTSKGKHIAVSTKGVFVMGQFNGTVDFDPGIGVVSLTALSSNTSFIARYDNFGNLIWVFKIDGSANDFDLDIEANIYLTGVFGNTVDFDPSPQTYNLTSFGGSDVFTAKYDSSGNLTWAKSFGGNFGDGGFSILLVNNEIIVHGLISDTVDMDPGTNVATLVALYPPPNASYFLAKYDTSGNYVWAHIFEAAIANLSFSSLPNNSFYATGIFKGTINFDLIGGVNNLSASGGSGDYDAFFVKYDGNCNLIWAKSIGSPNFSDNGWDIKEDSNENIFISGFFGNTADFDPGNGVANLTSAGNKDVFLAQYDTAGNYKWAGNMGSSHEDLAFSLSLDAYGNQYLTGFFEDVADFDPGTSTANITGLPFIHSIFIAKYHAIPNSVFNPKKQDELTLTVYPNPANDFIFCKEIIPESLLEITDALGKKVYFERASHAEKINIGSLAPGVYLLTETQKKNTYRAKFIKQ